MWARLTKYVPWFTLAVFDKLPPKTLGFHVSKWLSKWITLMGPYNFLTLLKIGRTMVWSPPKVITLGNVLPFRLGPALSASVAGVRDSSA